MKTRLVNSLIQKMTKGIVIIGLICISTLSCRLGVRTEPIDRSEISNVINNDFKWALLKANVNKEYSFLKSGTYNLTLNTYVRIDSSNNVGVYSYQPVINHLSFEKYFFNYPDTLIFVQPYDSSNWNMQIDNFLNGYIKEMSIDQKEVLTSLIKR